MIVFVNRLGDVLGFIARPEVSPETHFAWSDPDCQVPRRTHRQTGRGGHPLVQIIALVKPFRAAAVLAAIETHPIVAGTVREVMGYSRQKNRLHRYLGSEYSSSFLPKVEFTLFVNDEDAPIVVRAIIAQARTGRMGDGKIMILKCLDEHVIW